MGKFMKGMALCEGFFQNCARGIIEGHFPGMRYSAALIGYGPDVLGYDDPVSTDHMWGPRFYLFLGEEDIGKKEAIFRVLREELPYTYEGYSVNFTEPDPNDRRLTECVDFQIESYFGRRIKVIFADKFADDKAYREQIIGRYAVRNCT